MSLSDSAWRALISATHTSGRKAALAITGGGTGAVGEVLGIPGGSQLLIEAQVPYSEEALAAYLGFAPSQSCSAETAVAMANAARVRADKLAPKPADTIGLGATAALVSDRPRRGEHRFHIACSGAEGTAHCTVVLAKGRRDRPAEEALVARAIILWLARCCGVDAPSPQSLLDPDERFEQAHIAADDPIEALLAGSVNRVTALTDGRLQVGAAIPALVMPGSFNPLHEGHERLAETASELCGRPVAFEISVTNVDKPALTGAVVRSRLRQFAGKASVELTRAPTFLEKSRLFPGASFVVGADTAVRLVEAKYYGDSEDSMHAALAEIGAAGGQFLVAVRADSAGRLLTLADAAIPDRFSALFAEIPEDRFRLDLSSSAIREQRGS